MHIAIATTGSRARAAEFAVPFISAARLGQIVVDSAPAVARYRSRYTVRRGAAPPSPSASSSDGSHFDSATFPREFCHPRTFWRTRGARQGSSVASLVYCRALFGRNAYQVLARTGVSQPLGRKYWGQSRIASVLPAATVSLAPWHNLRPARTDWSSLAREGRPFFRHVFPWTEEIPEGNEYTRETRARHSLPCRRALTMARVFVQTRARPASGEHPLVFKTKLIADGWRRRPPRVAERKRRGRCDVTASSIREPPCCLPCLGAFRAPCTLPAFDCLFSNAINNAKNYTTRERRCSYAIRGPCLLREYYRRSHFQSAAALLSWESSGILTQK